ncbi:DNA-directed RNA polymerase II core subunit rpb9 [Coemansia sp. RSA 552]|nr:DNA-directed RNA polymerase II core subunit rpb9 [Coemansia sp. RSA 552]
MASIKFCQDCSNMLYPRVDQENRRLMFACRNCNFEEVADNNCVFRHEVLHTPRQVDNEKTMVITDLGSDPTLPRTTEVPCPKCGGHQAVFFQSQSRHIDTRMTLYYVCCNTKCQHRWQS